MNKGFKNTLSLRALAKQSRVFRLLRHQVPRSDSLRYLSSQSGVSIRIVIFLSLFIIGCQPDNSPVSIDKGLDMCQYCRMTVTDLHYAGEIIERKKVHKFDDIGCMLAYAQTHNLNTNNASFWVMDFDSLSWVKAEEANYVLSSEIKTPMAYGIIAFKDTLKANDTADKTKGEVMQFQTLFDIDWKARHAH